MGSFSLRLGVLGKFAGVSCLLLVAVASTGWLTVRTTRGATNGANTIDQALTQRVQTDEALRLVVQNAALVSERLQTRQSVQIRKLDSELVTTDEALARAIGPALAAGHGVQAERAVSDRIRSAYSRYLSVRNRVLRGSGRHTSAELDGLDNQLDRAAGPLRRALAAYAKLHLDEGNVALDDLRRTGRARNELVALLLAFGLLSLLATLGVARGIVRRLREYADFSAVVASGDLGARLMPRGRDELGILARHLNSMVDQLASSFAERQTSQDEESAYRTSQDTFSEILQVAESEREAHEILKLHLERGVSGSEVVVLSRNNSENRLEPATDLSPSSRLRESLVTAQPRSCLAVRLARPFESVADAPSLLECEVCGASAKDSTCLPLLVSGEVIGSVLVEHEGHLTSSDERRLHESVAQAAPTLANLRNLALAEARAATDALTGLPNRRAIQDTLKRMLAQSARTVLPMAVLMIDLDHFKKVNDSYGHEEGDAVLAAVGDILSNTVRASDFVGRNGGEEFVALLPNTGEADALTVAEKLRAAVETVNLARVDRTITASFGVAVHPDVAGDSETLLRLADRALYTAKAAGRNRVELAHAVVAGIATPQNGVPSAASA